MSSTADKTYDATTKEEEKRKSNFQSNSDFIRSHNEKYSKGEVSYQLGMNHFGDMVSDFTPPEI